MMKHMTAPEIRCSVSTRYLPEQSDAAQSLYAFSYTITLTNMGELAAQVIARHWVITDAAGHIEEVRGLGVVGHQPLLQPGERFEYSSWTRLATPHGRMQGTLFCITTDAFGFETSIPTFELAQASALH